MNIELLWSVLSTAFMVLLGGISVYFKYNKKLSQKVNDLIVMAENKYKDTTKSGGEKFAWVVDTLYTYIPIPLKIILPKTMIESIVQNAFNAIEDYAKTQLDKITLTKE